MKSYDLIASWYDSDMGQNNPGEDIPFYLRYAAANRGGILELGCGTGRMTLPFLKAGFSVLGMDSSAAMLQRLAEKLQPLDRRERQRLTLLCADMCYLCLKRKFKTVCCAFSLLTYLTTKEDQEHFFRNVHEWLDDDGHLLLDVFVPQDRMQTLPDDQIYFDYRRPWKEDLLLERSKQIIKHPEGQLNTIRRFYKILDRDLHVRKEIVTEERIRIFYPEELHRLLTGYGFRIEGSWGGFQGEALSGEAPVMVFLCSPADPIRCNRTSKAIRGRFGNMEIVHG